MGLLDQILGGLTGGTQGQGQSPMGRGSGGGIGGNVLMSLLPIVISMLSNRGGGRGGLAAPMMGGAGGMGGLGGLLQQLTQGGYGQQANSWVGTGANEPLPPQAWSQVLAPEQLSAIASQAGVSEDEARHGLSQLVPEVVDHLTPQGQLPPEDELLASIDRFASRMGR
jgi:uncharacterized protein YidB (DUF937 family)